jgi:hypothetical protein
MPGHDHIHDAIDLVRARISGRADAVAELLDVRGIDNEVCQRQLLTSQNRLATMLATALSIHEGRTVEEVLDSVAVAVMEVESAVDVDQRRDGSP